MRNNTLNLFITKATDNMLVGCPDASFFIPDHCFVDITVVKHRPSLMRQALEFRRVKSSDVSKLMANLQKLVDARPVVKDINILSKYYNEGLRQLLDKHAPRKLKTVTIRMKYALFISELIGMKKEKGDWRKEMDKI